MQCSGDDFDNRDNRSYYLCMSKSTKKELNREGLLNQGVTLFMEQGYHGTGLQEILDAVNVPKGSFIIILTAKRTLAPMSFSTTLIRLLHNWRVTWITLIQMLSVQSNVILMN